VLVLERAPRIDPIGAGLTLFANAMSALDRLGMRDAVAAQGAPAKRSAILTSEGRELAQVPQDLLEGTIAIHRADLQRELAAAAGELRLGAEITAVEQHADGVVVRGGDGSKERGDLLVGADGLSSVIRSAIADVRPRYAGYTAWRGVSPVPVGSGRLTESWGVGERFGLVDIGRGRTYWFATKNAPEGQPDEPEGKKAEILRRFAGWHDPIAAIADSVDEGAILRNDVYYLEPLPRWSEGRVVLVGDAAHATTPGRRPGRGPGHGGCRRAQRPVRTERRPRGRARRVRGDPAAADGGRAKAVTSRRQGRPACEPTRLAIEERHRPPAARPGSAPPAGAARSLRAVTPPPRSLTQWQTARAMALGSLRSRLMRTCGLAARRTADSMRCNPGGTLTAVNPYPADGNDGVMNEARSDADLLARGGDEPELIGILFDRYFTVIHRYLERRIGAEGADELSAEVFRVAFEQRRRFLALQESALPWLYGVATNLLLKHWRRERRHLRALARFRATSDRGNPALEGAEERLDARSARTQLLGALASLPQGDRDVVVLIAWEELSYEEVAAALAIPVGTVRSRLNRARRTLRERLGVNGNEPVSIACGPQGETR
jgi:RNA polymerase sigma factor (sigma-70 family)